MFSIMYVIRWLMAGMRGIISRVCIGDECYCRDIH